MKFKQLLATFLVAISILGSSPLEGMYKGLTKGAAQAQITQFLGSANLTTMMNNIDQNGNLIGRAKEIKELIDAIAQRDPVARGWSAQLDALKNAAYRQLQQARTRAAQEAQVQQQAQRQVQAQVPVIPATPREPAAPQIKAEQKISQEPALTQQQIQERIRNLKNTIEQAFTDAQKTLVALKQFVKNPAGQGDQIKRLVERALEIERKIIPVVNDLFALPGTQNDVETYLARRESLGNEFEKVRQEIQRKLEAAAKPQGAIPGGPSISAEDKEALEDAFDALAEQEKAQKERKHAQEKEGKEKEEKEKREPADEGDAFDALAEREKKERLAKEKLAGIRKQAIVTTLDGLLKDIQYEPVSTKQVDKILQVIRVVDNAFTEGLLSSQEIDGVLGKNSKEIFAKAYKRMTKSDQKKIEDAINALGKKIVSKTGEEYRPIKLAELFAAVPESPRMSDIERARAEQARGEQKYRVERKETVEQQLSALRDEFQTNFASVEALLEEIRNNPQMPMLKSRAQAFIDKAQATINQVSGLSAIQAESLQRQLDTLTAQFRAIPSQLPRPRLPLRPTITLRPQFPPSQHVTPPDTPVVSPRTQPSTPRSSVAPSRPSLQLEIPSTPRPTYLPPTPQAGPRITPHERQRFFPSSPVASPKAVTPKVEKSPATTTLESANADIEKARSGAKQQAMTNLDNALKTISDLLGQQPTLTVQEKSNLQTALTTIKSLMIAKKTDQNTFGRLSRKHLELVGKLRAAKTK